MSMELSDLLRRELGHVAAPVGLWGRIEAGLEGGRSEDARKAVRRHLPRGWTYGWVAAGLLVGMLVWTLERSRASEGIDLQGYLAPIQNASVALSGKAISQAPAHFRDEADPFGPTSLAGYLVTARREAKVDGSAVKQMVLTAPGDTLALFIAPSQVPLQTGRNFWTDSQVAGIACKRLSCPRTRTVLFPCLKQTCVLVCKACSETAILALIRGVDATPDLLR